MAVESTFSKYVESGSKINKFKSFFDSIQSAGNALNKIKSAIAAVQKGNLGLDALVKNKLNLKKLGLSDYLTSKMKEMGLSDEACKLVAGKTDSFMDTANDAVFSIYKTSEAFATSIAQNLYNTIIGSIFVPENAFLMIIKQLVKTGGDPNYANGYLRTTCLQQDLVDVLEWLDDYNNVSYVVGEARCNDALTAARNGAFNVAKYILKIVKRDYMEALNMPTSTPADVTAKENLLHVYTNYFYNVVKMIIVYSYANLTENDVRSICNDYNIKPSEFGTTGTEYGGKYKINSSDINILAPFYNMKDKTVKTKYINPRNNNIKKIYLILTSRRIYGDSIIVNLDLYNRLKNPIISTLQKATDTAKGVLDKSPLGKFIKNTEDSIDGTIYRFTKEMKDTLFNPKKQTYLSTKDCVVLPEPATASTTKINDNPTQHKAITDTLPQPTGLNGKYLDYDKFYVYFRDPAYSGSKVIGDVFNLLKNSNYNGYSSNTIKKCIIDDQTYSVTMVDEEYYIFYKSSSFSGDEYTIAYPYIIAKHLIDANMSMSVNNLINFYPSLPLSEFIKYKAILDSSSVTSSSSIQTSDGYGGITIYNEWKNYSSLLFFKKMLLEDNSFYNCDGTCIRKYSKEGNLLYTINTLQGIGFGNVLGIATDEYGNLYALTDSGVAFSYDDGLTYSNDTKVTLSKMHVINGTGFSTLSQIVFYKVFYYNNTFYSVTNTGIKYTSDQGATYKWINSNNGLTSNICYGISITASDMIYILTADGLFGRPLDNDTLKFKQYSQFFEGVFNIQITGIGTVESSVDIPYFSLDDFDIDDENIRKVIENGVLTQQELIWIYIDDKD